MHARGPGLDHGLGEFKDVERPAETGLGVGDDGGEPVRPVLPVAAFLVVNLVGALECLVDAPDHGRDTVGRIQALVGIHLPGEVRVRGDLPAGEVDGLQPGPDLLDGLVAGQGAEGVDVILDVEQLPQALGAHPGQGVCDLDRTAQAVHVGQRVRAFDALPAGVQAPVVGERRGGSGAVGHGG